MRRYTKQVVLSCIYSHAGFVPVSCSASRNGAATRLETIVRKSTASRLGAIETILLYLALHPTNDTYCISLSSVLSISFTYLRVLEQHARLEIAAQPLLHHHPSTTTRLSTPLLDSLLRLIRQVHSRYAQ